MEEVEMKGYRKSGQRNKRYVEEEKRKGKNDDEGRREMKRTVK